MEIPPADQSYADAKHQRVARWRRKNIYRWDPIKPHTAHQETPTTIAPAPALDDESVGEPDFYLNLTDARIVATEALLEASENIADTIEARAMSCFFGDAGLGKTFSVLAALKEVAADRVLLLQFRSHPTPRDIRMELFTALRLEGEPPSHPSEFDRPLKRTLARKPYVIVCDEAQQFSRECFEFVRHLWDTGKGPTRPAVLFVGGEEAYKTLYSEPALASRIHIRQEYTPMGLEEAQRNIPLFHPIWANAPAELIEYVDDEGGAGTFRMWSKITYHILEGMKRRGPPKPTRPSHAGPSAAPCPTAAGTPVPRKPSDQPHRHPGTPLPQPARRPHRDHPCGARRRSCPRHHHPAQRHPLPRRRPRHR